MTVIISLLLENSFWVISKNQENQDVQSFKKRTCNKNQYLLLGEEKNSSEEFHILNSESILEHEFSPQFVVTQNSFVSSQEFFSFQVPVILSVSQKQV